MNVSEIMTIDVKSVGPKDSVKSALVLMDKHKISCVLVSDDDEVYGIITEHDVIHRVIVPGKNIDKAKCEEIMSKPIIAIDVSTDISDAIDVMAKHKIKRLIVIDGDELVGIVTTTDILKSGKMMEREALESLSNFFELRSERSQAS